MPDCGCTHAKTCDYEGCQEKDALSASSTGELKKALKESAGLNARCTRH